MKETWTKIQLRRAAALLTALLALLALSACGGTPSSAEAPQSEEEAAAPAEAETAEGEAGETAEEALTMEAVIAANQTDTLLGKHKSILVEYENRKNEENIMVGKYIDAEIVYLDFGIEQDLLFRDGTSGYQHDTYEEVERYSGILEFDFDDSSYSYFTLDPDLTSQEEIVSSEQEGDTITLVTHLSTEAFRPIIESYGGEFPYGEGDYLEETYRLRAEDLAILENTSILFRADGTTEAQNGLFVNFDADRPFFALELMERRNGDDLRTGTVILDPGTEDERSASAVARRGDSIVTFLPEGYSTYYKDPACTEISPESEEKDLNADFTYYSVKD